MKRVPTPDIVLTVDEQRVLAAFRKMSVAAQHATILTTEAWAKSSPAHAAPSLRLVVGGVQ